MKKKILIVAFLTFIYVESSFAQLFKYGELDENYSFNIEILASKSYVDSFNDWKSNYILRGSFSAKRSNFYIQFDGHSYPIQGVLFKEIQNYSFGYNYALVKKDLFSIYAGLGLVVINYDDIWEIMENADGYSAEVNLKSDFMLTKNIGISLQSNARPINYRRWVFTISAGLVLKFF